MKTAITLLCLCLLLPALCSAQSLTLPMTGLVLMQAGDVISTERALNRVPGAFEANPIAQSPASRIALKAATTTGVWYLAKTLERKGHAKAGRVLVWAVTGAVGVVVVNNARIR